MNGEKTVNRLAAITIFLWALGLTNLAYASTAQEAVKKASDQVLAALKADREKIKADPEYVYGLVTDIILPHFDFPGMSQWVLGKYWRRADEAQRARFIEEFKNLLVRTYATALVEYSDETIMYLPIRSAAGAESVIVRTEIHQKGGKPLAVAYTMHIIGGAWKVYDINIGGMSLVSNYRSTFASQIRRSGLDGLLKTLASHNKKLKNNIQ